MIDEIWRRRNAGWTFVEIAYSLGIHPGTAQRKYKKYKQYVEDNNRKYQEQLARIKAARESAEFKDFFRMNTMQREVFIYQLREEGMTYKNIGEKLNLSGTTVRFYIDKYRKRKEDIERNNSVLSELSCYECSTARIRAGLLRSGYFNGEEPTARELAILGGRGLLRVKGLGRKSVIQVGESLKRQGLIEDVKSWLKSDPKEQARW